MYKEPKKQAKWDASWTVKDWSETFCLPVYRPSKDCIAVQDQHPF